MGLQWHLSSAAKSADFRKIGLAPRPANFEEFGRKLGSPIFWSNFLAREIGLFSSVQFSGPRPSPIFHQADFLILYRNCKEKIGLENGPENWTGEKLAWRKIGLAKNWPGKLDGQVSGQIAEIGRARGQANSSKIGLFSPGADFHEVADFLASGRYLAGGRIFAEG